MIRTLLALALVLGVALCFSLYDDFKQPEVKTAHGEVTGRRTNAIDLDAIDKFLTEAQKCRTLPSLSVGIIKNGEVVLKKGYGVRNVKTNWSLQTSTHCTVLAQQQRP
jgi:CubicO group peptidase (beta-lactamase class C family)